MIHDTIKWENRGLEVKRAARDLAAKLESARDTLNNPMSMRTRGALNL